MIFSEARLKFSSYRKELDDFFRRFFNPALKPLQTLRQCVGRQLSSIFSRNVNGIYFQIPGGQEWREYSPGASHGHCHDPPAGRQASQVQNMES